MAEKIEFTYDIIQAVAASTPLFTALRDYKNLGKIQSNQLAQSVNNSLIKLYPGVSIFVAYNQYLDQAIQIDRVGNGCFTILISLDPNRELLGNGQIDQKNSLYLSGFMHDAVESSINRANKKTTRLGIFITEQGFDLLCSAGAISPSLVKRLKQRIFDRPIIGEKLPADPAILQCAVQVMSQLADHQANNMLIFSAKLHELLNTVLTSFDYLQTFIQPSGKRSGFDVREFKAFLDQLDQFDFTLEQLAAMFGVSSSLLHKQFKTHYHMAISRYMQQRRMIQAQKLLLAAELPTATIATQLGYSSINGLGRAVKQATGLSITALKSSTTTLNFKS